MKRSAVIVAAGTSSRFGEDKLFKDYLGFPLLWHSVKVFENIADEIIVVCSRENHQKCLSLLGESVILTLGGSTRSGSVLAGLKAAKGEIVAVHDGARPFASKEFVKKCFAHAEEYNSCIPLIKTADTLYNADTLSKDNKTLTPLDREKVYAAQTPQVFDRQKLLHAFSVTTGSFTDEGQVWQKVYGTLSFTEGEITNKKITYAADLPDISIGQGYDIHKLTQGKGLYLGGVAIPYSKGLLAHSDGDVVIHALMDALLSSCSLPDIGHFFPDSDSKYKCIDSKLLLKEVAEILKSNNARPISFSVAIICQQPRLSPYIPQMKEVLCQILNISPMQAGISATTAEGVGEIGNNEAIAARASCIVQKF